MCAVGWLWYSVLSCARVELCRVWVVPCCHVRLPACLRGLQTSLILTCVHAMGAMGQAVYKTQVDKLDPGSTLASTSLHAMGLDVPGGSAKRCDLDSDHGPRTASSVPHNKCCVVM